MKFQRVAHTLGKVFKVFGVLMLLPAAASLFWDEGVPTSRAADELVGVPLKVTTASFLVTATFVVLLGFLLTSFTAGAHDELREREAYFIVGAGWLFCAILGSIPFLLAGATRDVTVALFESMSGITTTGFSALGAPLEAYPESVHVWRGSLHFFGGVGIVVVAVAIIGRLTEGAFRLISTETGSSGVARIRPRLTGTAKNIFGIYVAFNVLAFATYWLAIRYASSTAYGWKESAFHALVHSMGTIATGGMSTRSASIEAFGNPVLNTLVFVFMVIAGTQFVLYNQALRRGLLAFWENSEWRFYMVVIAGASVLVAVFLVVEGEALGFSAAYAPYTVVATLTTTGYTATNPDLFPDGAKLILLFLMFTGAMVGSTSGGIKLHRIFVLLRLTYRELAKLLHPHAVSVVKMGGKIFPEDIIRRVVVFFFVYVTVFIAGSFGFALLGFDLPTSIVASAASIGNIGFGFYGVAHGFGDPLGDFPQVARMLSFVLMWLGRLEIFTVLLLFVPATYRD